MNELDEEDLLREYDDEGEDDLDGGDVLEEAEAYFRDNVD